ncbi:MAG: SpoIIIAH-like family protein [Clostridia bacterium]|nr:SpoIIIAH-like family protein [Clostridia bacterium]
MIITIALGESKKDAISKINSINNTKNAIMIAENLIIAKGFKDVVIFVNDGSVSVVIQAVELKQEEVAQIQNIVSRELNVDAEMIHISNKS